MSAAGPDRAAEVAWDTHTTVPVPDLAPLDGPTSAEVVVVGLGASGLTACRRLAERGADVLGLDAVGLAAGAAGRNGGFLLAGGARFHHHAVAVWGHERAVALYRATLAELESTLDDLERHVPGTVLSRSGSLRIAHDDAEAADVAAHLAALHRDGLPGAPYRGDEGEGLLVPTDAAFDPVGRARHLAARAVAAGARLHAPVTVTDLAEGRVGTTAGEVTCHRAIVAVDGGLARVLPELAPRVRTARLQMLATAPTDAVLTRPVYRRWGYDYLQQLPTGEVLLGGCRDRHVDAEWDAPAEPSAAVQSCLDRTLAELGIDAPVTHRWAAHAAFTDDGWPVCDEVRPGVLALGGYSGHGNLVGTLAARRAADAALDRTPLSLS